MSTFALNTSHRQSRKDGHAILIVEANESERTFSDYPDEALCLETIVNMYEEYRAACCNRSDGDLKEFQAWMSDFYRIEMFLYDESIARYKHYTRDKLLQLFEEDGSKTAAKASNKDQNVSTTTCTNNKRLNGHSRGSVGSASMDDDDDEVIGEQIMDEENWDE